MRIVPTLIAAAVLLALVAPLAGVATADVPWDSLKGELEDRVSGHSLLLWRIGALEKRIDEIAAEQNRLMWLLVANLGGLLANLAAMAYQARKYQRGKGA